MEQNKTIANLPLLGERRFDEAFISHPQSLVRERLHERVEEKIYSVLYTQTTIENDSVIRSLYYRNLFFGPSRLRWQVFYLAYAQYE